jgi:hypothetical protein
VKTLFMRKAQLFAFSKRVGKIFLKSHILTVWVGLCGLGYFIGTQARPEPGTVPYGELFDNLRVLSYREAPSDSTVHFVVELSARGRAFQQYDVDSRRFVPAPRGRDYWRSINATSYPPLQVRGHVDRGVWLEIPDSSATSLVPEEFDELFSSTLDLVNPISITTSALGIVSGYSVGYRLATWGHSLSSPQVQERVLATPGIGRLIAREAWRRVALEPAVVFAEKNSGRFATLRGRQRLYTNFFKVTLNDSDGFIPFEVARLEAAGAVREARAMNSFATAVRHAADGTWDLSSADFSAVEEWASLLDRRGHWAIGTIPPPGAERIRYFGALSWYGLGSASSADRRLWVGPRMIVRTGDADGFVPDEIPRMGVACPIAWHPWLDDDKTHLSSNAWTAQWMGDARQFAPILDFGANVVGAVSGGSSAPKSRASASAGSSISAWSASPAEPSAPKERKVPETPVVSERAPDHPGSERPDSLSITMEQHDPDAAPIRSSLGGLGR